MCEKCDRDFAELSEEELRKEASAIADCLADLFEQVPPSPAGLVFLMAMGQTLQTSMRELFEHVHDERITPRIEEIVSRIAELATRKFVDDLTKEPALIVTPGQS
jgi:hypothetical protein